MNSKAASALSFALSIASDFSFQGNTCVGSPKGSAPLPLKLCQYAQANLKCSFIVLPSTILFSSYQRNANGLSDPGPSYLITSTPGKKSLLFVVILMLLFFSLVLW